MLAVVRIGIIWKASFSEKCTGLIGKVSEKVTAPIDCLSGKFAALKTNCYGKPAVF